MQAKETELNCKNCNNKCSCYHNHLKQIIQQLKQESEQLALSREESNNRFEAYLEVKAERDLYKNLYKVLNDCLDTKDELCKALREDNEKLRTEINKLKKEK